MVLINYTAHKLNLTIDPVNSGRWCIESRLRVSSQEGKWLPPIVKCINQHI